MDETQEFAEVVADLATDQGFMWRCEFSIRLHEPRDTWTRDWRGQPTDDSLDQHPGELCTCLHPAHDHQCVDGTMTRCLACECRGFQDDYVEGCW